MEQGTIFFTVLNWAYWACRNKKLLSIWKRGSC